LGASLAVEVAVFESGTVNSAADYTMDPVAAGAAGESAAATAVRTAGRSTASFMQAGTADPAATSPPTVNASSNATAAAGNTTATVPPQIQLLPSKLRVTILEVQPTLLSSYPWSLTSKPVAQQSGNVTMVGCQLIAAREQGVTGQLLTGVLRLGNPSRVTDADASVIRVRSVTVTAEVQSENEGRLQNVTTVAVCRGAAADGVLELMPWRRTNCRYDHLWPT
jgi:hypothetical protein